MALFSMFKRLTGAVAAGINYLTSPQPIPVVASPRTSTVVQVSPRAQSRFGFLDIRNDTYKKGDSSTYTLEPQKHEITKQTYETLTPRGELRTDIEDFVIYRYNVRRAEYLSQNNYENGGKVNISSRKDAIDKIMCHMWKSNLGISIKGDYYRIGDDVIKDILYRKLNIKE